MTQLTGASGVQELVGEKAIVTVTQHAPHLLRTRPEWVRAMMTSLIQHLGEDGAVSAAAGLALRHCASPSTLPEASEALVDVLGAHGAAAALARAPNILAPRAQSIREVSGVLMKICDPSSFSLTAT
jgi:hypothetical protein